MPAGPGIHSSEVKPVARSVGAAYLAFPTTSQFRAGPTAIRRYTTRDEPGLRRGVYAYDPAANAWADPLPLPAEVVKGIRNGNFGFFDPGLNAYFCYFAGDSADDGSMWVYRHQKGPRE